MAFKIRAYFGKQFIQTREHFFHAYIALSKHSEGSENSRKLGKPLTSSRVCITASKVPSCTCIAFLKYFLIIRAIFNIELFRLRSFTCS